jgi:hypothetical protein
MACALFIVTVDQDPTPPAVTGEGSGDGGEGGKEGEAATGGVTLSALLQGAGGIVLEDFLNHLMLLTQRLDLSGVSDTGVRGRGLGKGFGRVYGWSLGWRIVCMVIVLLGFLWRPWEGGGGWGVVMVPWGHVRVVCWYRCQGSRLLMCMFVCINHGCALWVMIRR